MLKSNFKYPVTIGDELLVELLFKRRKELFAELVDHIQMGNWYRIRVTECNTKTPYDNYVDYQIMLDFERINEERIVIQTPSLESMYFQPEKVKFKKLRNCIKYLLAKDGKR